ncbi:hypothetical protein EVG20_g3544 [Dentipellis fragilis]|uniref:Uncharacterized protein n=1 Tax=Dentipellis fragilis TaxID=205917 RepID=A0A4Y9Z3P8_9AGAM|nr:hypothetical protein EVG20_g3544 [Dentipellis fragilis]
MNHTLPALSDLCGCRALSIAQECSEAPYCDIAAFLRRLTASPPVLFSAALGRLREGVPLEKATTRHFLYHSSELLADRAFENRILRLRVADRSSSTSLRRT